MTLPARAPVMYFVDPTARIGEGCTIWHYACILQHVTLGRDVSIGSGTEIGRGSTIGARSRIGAHVFLPPNSTIGESVFLGPGVVCTDDKRPRVPTALEKPYHAEPPVIGDFASIGAGAVLLPGVKIGAHARVAAGAVVTKDVEPYAMVRGEPARVHELQRGPW